MLTPHELLRKRVFARSFRTCGLDGPFMSVCDGGLTKQRVASPARVAKATFRNPFVHHRIIRGVNLPGGSLFVFYSSASCYLHAVQTKCGVLCVPSTLVSGRGFFSGSA